MCAHNLPAYWLKQQHDVESASTESVPMSFAFGRPACTPGMHFVNTNGRFEEVWRDCAHPRKHRSSRTSHVQLFRLYSTSNVDAFT